MKRDMMSDVIKIGLAAAVIVGALPDVSWAQDLTSSVDEVKSGMTSMPIVLSGLAYLGGGATMLHGAGLLKKHADNPQNTPLAAGLTRLGIGGVIAALPIAMKFMAETLSQGDEDMKFNAMDKITG